MSPKNRRAREGDETRQRLDDDDRPLVREVVAELEARLRDAVDDLEERLERTMNHTLGQAGIESPEAHRRQHEQWGKVDKEFHDELLPWVRVQRELVRKKIDRMDKVKDQFIVWVVGGVVLFGLLCVYYGASAALQLLVTK